MPDTRQSSPINRFELTATRTPPSESERLRALADLNVLDTLPERAFDALVQAAALVCGVPISLISLVDAERQWFKANVGLPGVTETARDMAFCAHAIQGDGIFEVPDAMLDPRFADNALVVGDPSIRFYAGATLRMSDGAHAGTLCVIDRQPRHLNDTQRLVLGHLAVAAVHALEGRRALLAERELHEAAACAAAVLANSVDAIVTLALDGKVTHWNSAAERLFGYSSADMVGKVLARLVPAHRRHDEPDPSGRLSQSPTGASYETVRQHISGELIAVSISLAPIRHADGALAGATKIIRDIRQQVRAASVLADSEARFKALSESSPLGVFATDVEGACTYVNARWQAIFGLTQAQSMGDGWASSLHPDDRAAVFLEWQRAATEGDEFDMEFRVLPPGGPTKRVRSRARAHRLDDGLVTGYVGSVEDVTDQRATSDELAVSEQRVRRLYNSTPAMLHSIDPQGRLLTVSDLWLDNLGYTREEVIGRRSTEFMTEASKEHAKPNLVRLFTQGRADKLSFQMVCKNGQTIDVLLSALVEHDVAGQPVRGMAVVQNVTEQLRAERALSNERARLASIIDGTGAGSWEWNVQTGELRVNERWAAILGWTQAELGPVDSEFRASIAHPDELPYTRHLLREHFAGRSDRYLAEVRLRRRDSSWVWVEDRGRLASRTADGRPEWVFGVQIDITLRRQQEAALRKSEQLLNRTGEVAGVGGWELNVLTGEVTWSAQTRRIHGVTPDYVPVLSEAINFYAPEARPVIRAAVEQGIATGQGWDLELPLIQASGQRIWVRAVGSVEFEDGAAVRLAGAFQDVSVKRELDQALVAKANELQRSNEELERFAYVASHDLQEPLRMVTSYCHLLVRRHKEHLNAEAQEFLGFVVDGGQRAQQLIADLLSLAKLNSLAKPMQPVALESVLAGVLRNLRLQVAETGAVVTHDPLPVVLAEARQMERLLQNLISNALKFRGPKTPTVHIGALKTDGTWRFSITDNGIGIEPKFFERIFVIFQRLHLRAAYEGTGIGLAICKKVLDHHGGHIGVESQVGKGSTFFFTLPPSLQVPQSETSKAA